MRGPAQPLKQGGCGVRELSALGAGARIPSDASVQDRTSGRQRVPKKMHRIKVSLSGGHLRGFSQAMRSRHVGVVVYPIYSDPGYCVLPYSTIIVSSRINLANVFQ